MENSKKYNYIFSVVMAVYNCEPFLRETLDSIVDQDLSDMYRYENGVPTDELIPFEEAVQVIMVDDGSKDASGAICDEYAEKYSNFTVVHKVNGGVASARNAGLPLVEGKYMNFLDSDDKFSQNVLSEMYKFFEEHYDETDVITMPLVFFDAVSGAHWQNYKFRSRARVVDLFNEYDCPLMFVNASFFKSEYKDKVAFNGKLVCGEDIRFISEILSYKMTMGLVPYCHYDYRRRSAGEESLIQSSKKKIGWYFDYFTYLVDWAVDFCKNKWGYVPAYYQSILVCDIKWRFFNEYDKTAMELLGEEEFERYKTVLSDALKHFDDKFILEQRGIWNEHKYMMLTKKYDRHADLCIYPDDVRLRFDNTLFCWLSSCYTYIDFIKIKDRSLTIEGYTTMLGCSQDEDVKVCIGVTRDGAKEDSEEYIPCEIVTNRDITTQRLGEVLYPTYAFKAVLPLEDIDGAAIRIVCFLKGHKIVKKDVRFGKFSPIGKEFKNSYYAAEGYIVTTDKFSISVNRASKAVIARKEKAYMKGLKRSKRISDKKAYYAIKLAKLAAKFRRKKIWLVSDRQEFAGDNGEAFFKYLCENTPKNVKVYFAVNKESADYERLKKIGKVIPCGTHKYKFVYLSADWIISSQADEFVTNPFNVYYPPYRRFIAEKKFVFLQHGVTKDDISRWFNRYRVNITAFVTTAEPEKKSIVEGNYGYKEEYVWLTGFPRYDYLYNAPKKIITVTPTWRAYLLDGTGYQTIDEKKFTSSKYFTFYNSLFANERLKAALKEYGYDMLIKPHPRMLPYLDLFEESGNVKMFDSETDYKTIFAESDLFITDYSSTVFDFAYLKKPVIYCQFDSEEFFSGEHTYTKGYFDYERDGFGEVVYDVEATVDLIINYIQNECKLKPEYEKRIDSFFAFNDKNNSKRIVDKILEIS